MISTLSRSCHCGMGCFTLWMETAFRYGLVDANTLNKQSQTADKGWCSTWELGVRLTISCCKKIVSWNVTWRDSLTQISHKYYFTYNTQGPFEKFVDWRQCATVMQREAVTVMPHCSVGSNIVVAWVRVWVTVILKQPLPGWCSNSVVRMNFVFGLEKVDQKPYNSSIKPMEMMQ
jgi:hypothetical protein